MQNKKIAVIGAGPGGLTNAMILAHRGFEVTVFEKEDSVGGRNTPIKLDGYIFDTGPTFLMMNFILKDMFNEVEREADDYLTATKLEPMYRLKFSDFEFIPTGDKAQMEKQIAEHFPGNEKGYEKFLKSEKKRFEKIFPCLQKPYSKITDYTLTKEDAEKIWELVGGSMWEIQAVLSDLFRSPLDAVISDYKQKMLGMITYSIVKKGRKKREKILKHFVKNDELFVRDTEEEFTT